MNRDNLIAFYEADLARYGPEDARSLHWVSSRTQGVRFEVLYDVGPWEGVSVADVGCGLGDFVGFLASKGRQVKPGPGKTANRQPPTANSQPSTVYYNGYDLSPGMVQAARRKYPNAAFHQRDVLEQGFVGAPDYVVASGTFNIRIEEHESWFRRMIDAMYAACRRAVAFNFLALPEIERPSIPPNPEAGWEPLTHWATIYFEADPQQVLAYCRSLCPETVLRTNYLPGDYTVYMRKESPEVGAIQNDSTVILKERGDRGSEGSD